MPPRETSNNTLTENIFLEAIANTGKTPEQYAEEFLDLRLRDDTIATVGALLEDGGSTYSLKAVKSFLINF